MGDSVLQTERHVPEGRSFEVKHLKRDVKWQKGNLKDEGFKATITFFISRLVGLAVRTTVAR